MSYTKRVQHRKGTNNQHINFTGAVGEITYNLDRNSIHIHDGKTPGGFEQTRSDLSNVDFANLDYTGNYNQIGIATFNGNVSIAGTITDRLEVGGNINVTGISTISGFTFPTIDGKKGQVLTTDGDGNLNFSTSGGGAGAATRIYVSKSTGDDANDGIIQPVKTIKRATELASFRTKLPDVEPRFFDAGNLVRVNKNFIKEEVVGFITSTYPSILSNPDYDENICKRDVGYIVDALVYDLSFGGNSKSVEAGLAYWEGATNYVDGESIETIAGYQYIIDLSKYIINNVAVTTSYQSIENQVFLNHILYDESVDPNNYTLDGCSNVWSAIGSYIGIITSIIGIGTTAAPNVTTPNYVKIDAPSIFVEAGDYTEDNPIILYEGISLIGDSLRNTIVRPLNSGKDLIRVRNSSYITGLALKDYIDSEGVPQHTFDYSVSYDDPLDTQTSRVGYAGSTVNAVNAVYDNLTGIATITTDVAHNLINEYTVKLSGLGFTCDYDNGAVEYTYPEDNQSGERDFPVIQTIDPVTFVIRAGITTIRHFYSGGGTASIGYTKITRSPYIQNCSILSFLGGNGISVDGSKVIRNNVPVVSLEAENPVFGDQPEYGKSMVAATFTMISFGGIGWRTINDGYAQVVSCFQIFCRYGSLAQSGGYLSITNSATNFGLFALRATGFSPNSFVFDRGRVADTGVSGGLQTLKVIGLGRTDQDLYVLRFLDNNFVDRTSLFKPLTVSVDFNVATGINTTTNIVTIPAHPFIQGDSIVYIGDENSIPPKIIDGLVSGNLYYVEYIDASNFRLFEDESLTRLVSLGSTFVGINTFTKNNQEFIVNEVINTHNSYQKVSLASTTDTLNFISGREITQTLLSGTATGIALTYIDSTQELIVSVEEVAGERYLFSASGNDILDHSGSPISIGVTAVAGINTYYTTEFKVNSTTPGNVITNIANLPETYRCHFHRPSIINSSAHTWEYSGSGTDYNALPQNGGKTDSTTEQVSELGGRVYASGTNELGDFKIGDFITAFNRTGSIIFNNKVTIGQLDSLRLSLSGGIAIEEFSTDVNLGESELGGPQNSRVSTQLAIRSFLGNRLGDFIDKTVTTSAVPNAVVQLNSGGQINPDLIPPKVVNFVSTNVGGGRTTLVDKIPAVNIKQGDTVVEPIDSYVLINDTVSEFLILDDDSRDYNFNSGDVITSALSAGSAIGIVTTPTAVGYGSTGLVKGVCLTLNGLSGGSGYTNPGIYTSIPLDAVTGFGTDILATITVGGSGNVTAVGIETGGRYYQSGDVLTVNDPNVIGGRTGGANFQVIANTTETRLYLTLTNNQKFPGTAQLPDYIQDNDAVGLSTLTLNTYSESFNPEDIGVSGDVDFSNNRIIALNNQFSDGDPIVYSTGGGNAIGGLVNNQSYYIKRVGINSVELHNSYALSSAINLLSSGTGTHSLNRVAVNVEESSFIFVDHGFSTGDSVRVSGDTPVGISSGSFYYLGSVTQNSFTFHTTRSDAVDSVNGSVFNPVGLASTSLGTITLTKQNVRYSSTVNTSSSLLNNWSLLAKSDIDAANIVSGTVAPTRLGSGSATENTFLAGNSEYQKVVKSVGIGTTQPIQVTATSFDLAPGGVGVNTYYGNINIALTRVSPTLDLYSTTGVAKFKTSTFDIGPDGEVSIKNSISGDVDAATLGGQSGTYFLDPANLTAAIPISKGGTGQTGLPAIGSILIGNGTSYNLTTTPTFTGDVTISSSTSSTNTGNGALVVGGGIGIGGTINVGGNATINGQCNATTFVETSSITLKENINPILSALDDIMKLNPVTYDRKDGSIRNESGLIAEEVNDIIPSIVSRDENGNPEGIHYSRLTAYLIQSIKELKSEINSLRNYINSEGR